MGRTGKSLKHVMLLSVLAFLGACTPPRSPAPARLLIKVDGAPSATVEVTSATGQPVFRGAITGQIELAGLVPGPYRVDGQPANGVDPDPIEVRLGPGERGEVTVSYPSPKAHLTVKLKGIDRAGVVISREDQPVFSGEVAGQRDFLLEPGGYTVDGQPASGADPPAVDVELRAGAPQTLTLDYSAPPPPPAPGVRFLKPAPGEVLDQPVLHVELELDQPALYQALHVALLDRGVLKVWTVHPGTTRYTADIVLDPDSYNGDHTLLARVQKLGEASWTEAAAQPLTVQVPWKGSAFVEFTGLPSEVALEPGTSQTFTFTARSRNGFEGEARFSADALPGVTVSVPPDRATFAVGATKTLTLTVAVDPAAASGTRQAVVRWQDAWGLRTGYADFPVKASRKPVPRFSSPPSPWHARPVAIEVGVDDDGVMKEVRFYVDGQLLAQDDAAPYQASWDPGLQADGPHRLRAEAEDSLGFVGTVEMDLDLAIPLAVRRTLPLPATPAGAPFAFQGSVYLAAGDQVLRLTGPDATPDTLTLPSPVRKLLAWNDHLYAATDTGVHELAPDLTSTSLVWGGVSDFRALVAGSEPVAVYGNRLRALVSSSETLLPAAPSAAAASASLVFLGYPDGRLERRILGSSLPPEVRSAKEAIADLAVAGGALWQSTPTRVWRYPLTFNLLKSPDAFATADWTREGVTVDTDVAPDPEGEPRADRVTRDPAGAPPFRLFQSVPLAEGTYAFGVFAKGDPTTTLTLLAERTSDGSVLASQGPITLSDTDPWSYLEVVFTVPAGGGPVRVVIELDPAAQPALLSHSRLWEAPATTYTLCGAPNPFQPGGYFTDAGGCVFQLGRGKVLSTGHALLPGVGVDGNRFYLASSDGSLEAWEGAVLKATERPVAVTPVGGILDSGYLYLGYADGALRILDPLP